MFDAHHICFQLTGELALAGFFLMTHWPNPETTPELEPSDGPLRLSVDMRGSGLDDLKSTLDMVAGCDGALGGSDGSLLKSVEAWSKEIDRLCSQHAVGLLQSPNHSQHTDCIAHRGWKNGITKCSVTVEKLST
jgi:hypothetical protein